MLRCSNTKINCRVPLVCVDTPVDGRGSSTELRHVQPTTRSRNLQPAVRFSPLRLTATSSTSATKRNQIHGLLIVYLLGGDTFFAATSLYIRSVYLTTYCFQRLFRCNFLFFLLHNNLTSAVYETFTSYRISNKELQSFEYFWHFSTTDLLGIRLSS
jgi:hypothetical protein